MKKIIALATLCLSLGAATVIWEPNPAEEKVTHYLVHVSNTNLSSVHSTTNTSYEITGLAPGETVNIWVTAVNEGGESLPSESVSWTEPGTFLPPSSPVITLVQPPPSPLIGRAYWMRKTNSMWHLAMDWKPVAEADSYVITVENPDGPVSTNSTTALAFYRDFVETNQWTVWLQSSNRHGLSRRETYSQSPR